MVANSLERIGVIGLGYVGLPLALALSENYDVVGYDINPERVDNLVKNIDNNFEHSTDEIERCGILFTKDENKLRDLNRYIVTVPTPINDDQSPDLTYLTNATTLVGKYLKTGDVVIYESTIYPGGTEEICVPILEKLSGKTLNKDFFVGYSPERVNPGDKVNTLRTMTKIISASHPDVVSVIKNIYQSVSNKKVHIAETIKVAEAAKIVENIQRDVNIALMNELATILRKQDVSIHDVLNAAGTKWNFLKFTPGLVGGHCIGIDPYYFIHKSKTLGVNPRLIENARFVNNDMAKYICSMIINEAVRRKFDLSKAKILLLGLSFKENVSDCRNSKSIEIYQFFNSLGISIDAYDPKVDPKCLPKFINIIDDKEINRSRYQVIICAVPHDDILTKINEYQQRLNPNGFFFDLKSVVKEKNNKNVVQL